MSNEADLDREREWRALADIAQRALSQPDTQPEAVPWLGILGQLGQLLEARVDQTVVAAAIAQVRDELEQLEETGGPDLAIALLKAQGLAWYAAQRGAPADQRRAIAELAELAQGIVPDAEAAEQVRLLVYRYGLSELPELWPALRCPLTARAEALADRLRLTRRVILPPAISDPAVSWERQWQAALAHAADAGRAPPQLQQRITSLEVPVELAPPVLVPTVRRSLRPDWALALTVRQARVLAARSGWRPFLADDAEGETWRLPLDHLPLDERLAVLRQPIVVDGIDPRVGPWRLTIACPDADHA